MMRNITFRPKALQDITNIADYTIEQWGKYQARIYVAELREAITQIGGNPGRYPFSDLPFSGLRRMRARYHLVYFMIEDASIDVVRILHERMDVTAQLND